MAIDTCQLLSEEQNPEQQKLKVNEIVSNSQSNETLWALGQKIDSNHGWEFFQGLQFKSLKLFLKYYSTQSFGIKMQFSVFCLKKTSFQCKDEMQDFCP